MSGRIIAPRPPKSSQPRLLLVSERSPACDLRCLRVPPPELREAVHLHFRLRKDALLKEVHGWRDDPHNSSPHTTKLKALCTELEAEFAKLPSQ